VILYVDMKPTWASEGFFPGGGHKGIFADGSHFPLKTKKTTFFCWKFQNPFRRPWKPMEHVLLCPSSDIRTFSPDVRM